MRSKQERQIIGNYQTRKTICKNKGEPFLITQGQWTAAWRSHPDWQDSGFVVKRDPNREWTACNIHYEPLWTRALRNPNPMGSRTLSVRQWIAELRHDNK